ncbi:MAG: hypothetical protein M1830_003781 [Pleopsidium flavum]|nr:MAG: hypothetical protein M1830_003781 [Pleopsidium flavum]
MSSGQRHNAIIETQFRPNEADCELVRQLRKDRDLTTAVSTDDELERSDELTCLTLNIAAGTWQSALPVFSQCLPCERDHPPENHLANAVISSSSPLEALHKRISLFFNDGHERASFKFAAVQASIANGEMVISRAAYPPASMQSTVLNALPWKSCKLAATLVLVHAAASNTKATFEALRFQSRSLNGLPFMATINTTPSADLAARFAQAKKAAIDGKVGQCTVLGVGLVDVGDA